MAEENTQRRFAVMGTNIYKVLNKLVSNQRLCRLLKYSVRDPFSQDLPDVDGEELIHKRILVAPKIYDSDNEKTSSVAAIFGPFRVNQFNSEFKTTNVRFVIACPYDEWFLDGESLRPYLIMQEIDSMFNQKKLSGIGNLEFVTSDPLTLSPQIGGYSMQYVINEFN